MNAEQKQRAIALLTKWWAADSNKAVLSTGYDMAGVLQELIDAPEPEPVAHAILLPNGATRIWFSDRDSGERWREREGCSQELTPLYTAPPVNNQSEQHLEMVNPPAPEPEPSVPDWLETTRFLTDVMTAAGLLAYGRRDKGLARRISEFAFKYQRLAAAPERDPELARDAERYRWLRNWTRRAYGIDSNPAFILPHVPIPTGPDQNIMRGSLAQHLDNAIDAAIERDKKGDQS